MSIRDRVNTARHVSIVPIAPEHIEGYHRALDTVARERRYLAFVEALPLAQSQEFVLNNIKSGNPHFVALREGEVVGWCDIRRHFVPSLAHRGTLGMGVISTYRGLGVGFRVLNAALDAAFEVGIVRVELEVFADNSPAIALYDKVGFTREGVTRDAVCIDGEYRDAIAMAIVRRTKASQC